MLSSAEGKELPPSSPTLALLETKTQGEPRTSGGMADGSSTSDERSAEAGSEEEQHPTSQEQ